MNELNKMIKDRENKKQKIAQDIIKTCMRTNYYLRAKDKYQRYSVCYNYLIRIYRELDLNMYVDICYILQKRLGIR